MNEAAPYFIAIDASGVEGLQDIIDLLRALSRPLAAVVMVVLHRPSDEMSNLRLILAASSDFRVVIAAEAETLMTDICYIGKPDGHLTLVDTHIAHLVPGANNRLLAEHAGKRTIGIVLSGWLNDGSRGLAAIKAAGGSAMVLEPGSNVTSYTKAADSLTSRII